MFIYRCCLTYDHKLHLVAFTVEQRENRKTEKTSNHSHFRAILLKPEKKTWKDISA